MGRPAPLAIFSCTVIATFAIGILSGCANEGPPATAEDTTNLQRLSGTWRGDSSADTARHYQFEVHGDDVVGHLIYDRDAPEANAIKGDRVRFDDGVVYEIKFRLRGRRIFGSETNFFDNSNVGGNRVTEWVEIRGIVNPDFNQIDFQRLVIGTWRGPFTMTR